MGFFKDMRQMQQSSKDMQQQMGYQRPTMREAMQNATQSMQDVQSLMAQQQHMAQLLQTGMPGMATITGAREAHTTVNGSPLIDIDLQVAMPGMPPYPVTRREIVSPVFLGRLQPGSPVGVRVNPQMPTDLAIDWSQPGLQDGQPYQGAAAPYPQPQAFGEAPGYAQQQQWPAAYPQPGSSPAGQPQQQGIGYEQPGGPPPGPQQNQG